MKTFLEWLNESSCAKCNSSKKSSIANVRKESKKTNECDVKNESQIDEKSNDAKLKELEKKLDDVEAKADDATAKAEDATAKADDATEKADDAKDEASKAEESIKDEKSFRDYARNKFEEVFGDDLDEKQMKRVVNGILDKYKKNVEDNDWGTLVGVLNKSFGS